jgi:hypothetical protein
MFLYLLFLSIYFLHNSVLRKGTIFVHLDMFNVLFHRKECVWYTGLTLLLFYTCRNNYKQELKKKRKKKKEKKGKKKKE